MRIIREVFLSKGLNFGRPWKLYLLHSSFLFRISSRGRKKKAEYEMGIATDHAETGAGNAD